MIDILKGEINFLKSAWDLLGRPLVTLVLKRIHLGRSTERESRASFVVVRRSGGGGARIPELLGTPRGR